MTSAAGAAGLITYAAAGGGGLLTPALAATPQGHNLGSAITAAAAGFALLLDSNGTTTPPTLASGFTSIATATDGVDIASRLSWKVVTASESIPAVSGSRRLVRIYSNVDAGDPFDDFDVDDGVQTPANLPALTITSPGRLVVGFIKGATTITWGTPIDQNVFAQNTSAVVTSAETNGLVASYAGQTVSTGTGNPWNAYVVALNGSAA